MSLHPAPNWREAIAPLDRCALRSEQWLPLLRRRVVIEADRPRDLPGTVLILPEVDEPALAGGAVGLWVEESVDTDLYRTVTLHVMNLECSGHQLSPHVATADVLFDAFGQLRIAEGYAALIGIKLHVGGEEGAELLQVATVVSVEERHIKR